jgi:hypothetical protein
MQSMVFLIEIVSSDLNFVCSTQNNTGGGFVALH